MHNFNLLFLLNFIYLAQTYLNYLNFVKKVTHDEMK